MLNAVHKQLLAAKLADLFASSPLVMVYQIMGNVRSAQVAASVQRQLDQTAPNSGLRATCVKMKNTVAAVGSKQDVTGSLAGFLRANNILVGWQLPQSSVLQSITAHRGTSLDDILSLRAASGSGAAHGEARAGGGGGGGGPQQHDASTSQPHQQQQQQQQQRPALPHALVVPAIQHSVKLQDQLPVALLAAFYQGTQVKLKHLGEWVRLDEGAVLGALLQELDGPSVAPLLQLEEGAGQALVTGLDACLQGGVEELVYVLEQRQQQQQQQQ